MRPLHFPVHQSAGERIQIERSASPRLTHTLVILLYHINNRPLLKREIVRFLKGQQIAISLRVLP
jgi:hypothetical protein